MLQLISMLTSLRRAGATAVPAVRAALLRFAGYLVPIAQTAVTAGAAWWVAVEVAGHEQPLLAPLAAVVCLSVARGARSRRAGELIAGVTIGTIVSDVVVRYIGNGPWQICLVVAVAMSLAVLLDGGSVIVLQSGSSAALVAAMASATAAHPFDRVVDALIGGALSLVALSVLPTDPVRRTRRCAAAVLDSVGAALRQTSKGLSAGDISALEDALALARSTQSTIDSMRVELRSGSEVARMSPIHWRARRRIGRLGSIADPIDNAARNTRVLVRRALIATYDGEQIDPKLAEAVSELATIADRMRQMILATPATKPNEIQIGNELERFARALPQQEVSAGFSSAVVSAQVRSIVIDFFEVCGIPRAVCRPMLPRPAQYADAA
ncbi:aromatic acid exporter family protein [Rhodococcus sp. NPDC056960]|uniref:FUSC family protein n=1 Tax=Rhodococcus sp. NPDC056960 TaxID=3345982 RepID=UPI0036341DFC